MASLYKGATLGAVVALSYLLNVSMTEQHRVTSRTDPHHDATRSLSAGRPAQAPNVMGTVALTVDNVRQAERWRVVVNSPVPNRPEITELLRTLRGQPRMRQLDLVNRWMNHRLEFALDQEVYGVADHWAPLSESLPRGRGDCEDYAIGKMQLLRVTGVPTRDMYMVIARDLVRNSDHHALLVVHVVNEFIVLDSSNDLLLTDREAKDYQPVISFSGSQSWVHGYQQAEASLIADRVFCDLDA